MKTARVLTLAIIVGFLLLLSLGLVSLVFALPLGLLTVFLQWNRLPTSKLTRITALMITELAVWWFVLPGLISRLGVAPTNYTLTEALAALLLVLPPATYFLARNRTNGLNVTGMVLLIVLFTIVGVPFIPIGGACTGQEGNLHCVSTYGSASWLFVCSGTEYATPPGDVSTGFPLMPFAPIPTPLGSYFSASCIFA